MELALRPGRDASAIAELLAARIALGKRAVAANPASRKARCMLCDSLLEADRPDLAIAVLQADDSHDLDELTALARVQFVSRDFAAVVHTLERASECARLGPEQLLLCFEALMKQGRQREARTLLATVQQLEPHNVTALGLVLCEALGRGDYGTVLAACERALEGPAEKTTALYYRMVALALSRQDTQAAVEMAMDRFVTIQELGVPDGFADRADFHRRLALEIQADPTLRPDPQGVATRNGWQTLSRSLASGPVMASLLAMIGAAVQRFVRGLQDTDAHPFVQCRPDRCFLQFWSVLYSSAGYQRSHFHPGGWLSGVYHASGSAASEPAAGGGALVLGECRHLQRAKITPPWGLRTARSRAGQLVLFPSFVPHMTLAPHAGDDRLSVAFDVKRSE